MSTSGLHLNHSGKFTHVVVVVGVDPIFGASRAKRSHSAVMMGRVF